MALPDRCGREIRAFHDFLEGWLGGTAPDDGETFARAERALAEKFEITSPSRETRDRAAILADLRAGHGTHAGSPFEIRIEAVRPRFTFGSHCLLTYEEHQTVGNDETARKSTVLFGDGASTEHGVEWRHLHETWTEGGDPRP